MDRECPKCGSVNPQATGLPTETCPTCTVVYSKASLARAQQRLADEQRRRSQSTRDNLPGSGWDRLCWGFAALGSASGLCQLGYTLAMAPNALQQATGTCIALAMAVIPYCLARALTARRK